MTLLYILSFVAILFQICFVTVAAGKFFCFVFFNKIPFHTQRLFSYLNLCHFNVDTLFFNKLIKPTIYFTAAGLYYLAELVEEYTVVAKKVITYLVLAATLIYVLFIFLDGLPWSMVICGLIAQFMHGLIMANFPYVKFLSVPFIGAFTMLLVNHWLAFQFFGQNYYAFSEVCLIGFIRISNE